MLQVTSHLTRKVWLGKAFQFKVCISKDVTSVTDYKFYSGVCHKCYCGECVRDLIGERIAIYQLTKMKVKHTSSSLNGFLRLCFCQPFAIIWCSVVTCENNRHLLELKSSLLIMRYQLLWIGTLRLHLYLPCIWVDGTLGVAIGVGRPCKNFF